MPLNPRGQLSRLFIFEYANENARTVLPFSFKKCIWSDSCACAAIK